MRVAFLKIFDRVNDAEISTNYEFIKVTNYYKLLKDLPKIYKKINNEVDVKFIYDLKFVEDYNNFILSNDVIFIELVKAETIYFLYDIFPENRIRTTNNIQDLYKIYLEEMYHSFDCEILLYKKVGHKIKLLDVLDSPIHYKNKCINRLVKKYNY